MSITDDTELQYLGDMGGYQIITSLHLNTARCHAFTRFHVLAFAGFTGS